MNNFYFAQLEEIERFGLTTLFVDFENLQDFSVEGEVGVLATAVATQYYRYNLAYDFANSGSFRS